jgi:hypothetical protein
MGFVVDKVALVQVFSEYFGFPCQFSFHRLLPTHHLSSGAGTVGQLLADITRGLSLTRPQETKKKKKKEHNANAFVGMLFLTALFIHCPYSIFGIKEIRGFPQLHNEILGQ